MRIKTATGEVIDLQAVRAEAESDVAASDRSEGILCADDSRKIIVILDALEAALSVQKEARYTYAHGLTDNDMREENAEIDGANRMRRIIRQAAGVVEGEA